MSILRDLYDIFTEIGDDGIPLTRLKNNTRYSVAKEANKGVLQFPVLCSSALALEEASIISKALEREYVSFVRIITSIDNITDVHDVDTFLKGIHQNFDTLTSKDVFNESQEAPVRFDMPMFQDKVSMSIKQLNESMKQLMHDAFNINVLNEEYDFEGTENEEYDLFSIEMFEDDELNLDEAAKLKESMQIVVKGLRQQYPKAKIYKVPNANGIIIHEGNFLSEAFFVQRRADKKLFVISTPKYNLNESVSRIDASSLVQINSQALLEPKPMFRTDVLNDKTKPRNFNVVTTDKKLSEKYNTYGKNVVLSESPTADAYADKVQNSNVNFRNVFDNNLNDNDVKKANELVPTTIHVRTYFKNELGELQDIDYLIGVKTIMHTVPSESMIENTVRGVKRSRPFFNFLKWTTGETEFFRDFVLTVDDIKGDVKSKFKDSAWWNALTRRKKMSKVLRLVNLRTQLVPNTTLVMTMDEVQKIKNEYSIDLMNAAIARELVSEYFLLGFVVADSSVEVGHFFFDGQMNYQQQSYASLERENSNQARDIKSIMQVIGKM